MNFFYCLENNRSPYEALRNTGEHHSKLPVFRKTPYGLRVKCGGAV